MIFLMFPFFVEKSADRFDGNDREICADLCRKWKIIVWFHWKTLANGLAKCAGEWVN